MYIIKQKKWGYLFKIKVERSFMDGCGLGNALFQILRTKNVENGGLDCTEIFSLSVSDFLNSVGCIFVWFL